MTRFRSLAAALAVVLATSLVAVDHADARRGGSFGSRGARTYLAPAPTQTASGPVSPISPTMAPRSVPAAAPQMPSRPGLFGGGLMRGLLIGGALGMLLGYGFGGLSGLLALILQFGVIALVAMLAMRFFAARQPATPGGGFGAAPPAPGGLAGIARGAAPRAGRPSNARDEIGIGSGDLDTFERLLGEIQTAYGREDRAALAARTMPEAGAVLREELDGNAARGLRNEVADVQLLQGDLAEAWREGDTDYATVAMRYRSRDATVERASGRVVEGDAQRPTETKEVWTFARSRGSDWRLAAIQEAA
ncbi:Tim44 domain-containing protein [Labrys wisconsinensis]|uniref:Lipid-binding transport protein (Tim44 family) n=1 Tax=Labrys wisconsinensis TaxID=425677 RepID=A0ABU0IZ70_9HYPH|nr:Tim44 domain-containing protein [Labrys wisconsinensis]MDQ0467306.1 putative lipid-binding transport protein (Tim44 family) [Labrys wisconsinensis]